MNEASLEATAHAAIKNIFPSYSKLKLTHQINYSVKLGHETVDVKPSHKKVRLDILIKQRDLYVIWGGDYPVLQTNLQKVLRAIDDVLAVDFDTFVYCPSNYVIEFYHEGEIALGKGRADYEIVGIFG